MANHQRTTKEQTAKPASKMPKPVGVDTASHASAGSPAHLLQRVTSNPRSLRPADILHLQRLIGNRAVGNLLAQSMQQPVIQAKLTVNAPGDKYEQEAATDAPAQLKEPSSDKPNNTGLPDNLKSGIEHLSGLSMDSVRVHYNSSQPAQLNALAYAQGTDIYVAPGQEQHLPHEAWHVVQQAQGRVQPTMQMKGGVQVNDDQGLEAEADVMGARALEGGMQSLNGSMQSKGHQNFFNFSSVVAPIQLMGSKAIYYIDKALLGLKSSEEWNLAKLRLNPDEIGELEKIWTDKGADRKVPVQIRVGKEIAERLIGILATIRSTTIGYQNDFDRKHTYDGDVNGTVAVKVGNGRFDKPAFSTVFKKSYLEAKLISVGVVDGSDQQHVGSANADGETNIALAKLHETHQKYKAIEPGIFQYTIFYTVVSNVINRTRVITATHLQTA